jgi:uncharacterized membrane protein
MSSVLCETLKSIGVLAAHRVDMLKYFSEKGLSRSVHIRGSMMGIAGSCRLRLAQFGLLLCLATGSLLVATPARADFRVCNATQNLVGVAIGYRAPDGWKTEGWWQIEGSTCKTMIEGALSSRFYYLYAEDAERGGRWDGPVNMCVAEKEFKIVGVTDCFARGFQRAGFKEYDTGEQSSWMVQLTDDPAAGAPTPPVAGTEPAETEEQ